MIQMASFGRKGRSGQIQDNTLSVHKRIILEAFFSLFSAFFYVFSLNRLLLTGSAVLDMDLKFKESSLFV